MVEEEEVVMVEENVVMVEVDAGTTFCLVLHSIVSNLKTQLLWTRTHPTPIQSKKVWVSLSLCSFVLVIGALGHTCALNTTSPTLHLSVVCIAGVSHTAHGRHTDGP